MIVLLMGLRASGKSTLGRALAERLGARFADLDDLTLARLGVRSVEEAWRTLGEGAFRAAEADALADALAEPDLVLALGGGSPTAPGAAGAIRAAQGRGGAVAIYLRASPDCLADRLAREGADQPDRPPLTGEDPAEEMHIVHGRRDPLYKELADETIDAEAPPEVVLERLLGAALRLRPRGGSAP